MRVICAWCKRVMHEGDATEPTSHGICAECQREMNKDIDHRIKTGAWRG